MLVGAERAGGYSFRAAEVAVLMLTKVDPPLFGWAADVTGKSNEEVACDAQIPFDPLQGGCQRGVRSDKSLPNLRLRQG
jgi:hypothetical protein